MRLILKPLFEAPLPPEFVEVLREKLMGKEVEEGETVEIELLGKRLPFRVLYAEPSQVKVGRGTRIEVTREEISSVTLEFNKRPREVLPMDDGFVLIFDGEVRVFNRRGHEVYRREFDNLNKVSVVKNTVVVLHGKNVTLIHL